MSAKQFRTWKQTVLLGASLKVIAPTGQYDPNKLINWGNNRWAFKPELGYSQRWGKWIVDWLRGRMVLYHQPQVLFDPRTRASNAKPDWIHRGPREL